MKRLGIVVMYDSDGIAHDYLLYYLNKLKMVCDRLILTVNGLISDKSREKVGEVVDDIFIRNNDGLDIEAYIDTIYNYITLSECFKYDEVVLSNDTLFGPFIEFCDIFDEMKDRTCDVWGLNINPGLFAIHIQSYFYCFRNQTISEALEYWHDIDLPLEYTKNTYIGAYEIGLSYYLTLKRRRIGSYALQNKFDVFNTPQMLLKYCNFPFLKKSINSSTLKKNVLICNYIECIDYIEKNSTYPTEYIIDYLKTKYNFDIDNMRQTLGVKNKDDINYKYNQFINEFHEVYLYGTGEYGQMFYGMLGESRVKGFVVSSHEHEKEIYNKKVYCIDEIDKDSPILVTMSEANTKEVVSYLTQYKNVCYIW